jgi:hypothetical protein
MFQGFGGSSKDRHITGSFTSMFLDGGADCGGCLTPDLYVRGGAKIKKKLCVIGKTTLQFVDIKDDLLVEGNVNIKGNITASQINIANISLGNIVTTYIDLSCGNIANVMTLTVDTLNAKHTQININNDIDVQGNITVTQTIITPNIIATNITANNISSANITTINITTDTLTVNNISSANITTINITTDSLTANNISSANITTSHLDLNCGNISNVNVLIVDKIHSKGIDVGADLKDVVVFTSPPIFGVKSSGGGDRNHFWGYKSGYSMTKLPGPSYNNVAIGYSAMSSTNKINNMVAIGAYAFENPKTSIPYRNMGQSVAIGSYAMRYSAPEDHVAIGHKSAYTNNPFFGKWRFGVTIGSYSGYQSYSNNFGSVYIGYSSGSNRKSVPNYYRRPNTFIGPHAGAYTNGDANIVLGSYAGSYAGTFDSIILGYNNSIGNYYVNTTLVNTISIGNYNGPIATSGYFADNVLIGGQNIERCDTIMYGIVAIGARSMQTAPFTFASHCSGIVCIGNNAWTSFRSTNANKSFGDVVIGAYTCAANTYLRNETVIGYGAGTKISPTLGGSNVVIGTKAASLVYPFGGPGSIKSYNTIIGAKAMGEYSVYNSCGISNVLIGDRTKLTSINSNRNVIVGSRSNASTFSDTVCLGFNVVAHENNSLNLGNVTLVNAGPVAVANLKVWINGTAYALPLHTAL